MDQPIEDMANRTSDPALLQGRHLAPRAENSIVKLRTRWPLVVLAAVLGAALGGLLTYGTTTYETAASVQISDSSEDSARVKQVAQTVERTAMSTSVLKEAAESRGLETSDLAARTTARWETDTDVVYITVRGADADAIVDDADAVVSSLRNFYDLQTRAEIKELSEQGDELLASGLANADAEEARRSGVGSALAARQGAAAAGLTTVTLLDSAGRAKPTGLSRPIALVLGAFVGIVLSSAAALLLPFRRRKVRRVSEVPVLLPGVRGVSVADNGAAEVVGLFLESECTDLAVVAMDKLEQSATSFASDVVTLLQAHGLKAAIMDVTERSNEALFQEDETPGVSNLASFQFLGRSGRDEAREANSADALVVVTTARRSPLSLLSGQQDVLAVVVARARRSKARDLRRIVAQLRHSDPTVALLT